MSGPKFDTEALGTDYSDEFASVLGGYGTLLVDAHEKEAAGFDAEADDDDDDELAASGADALDAILSEAVEGHEPKVAAAPVEKEKPTAYSKDDLEALKSLEAPPRQSEDSVLAELRAQNQRLEKLLAAREPQEQPARGPAPGRIAATGNAEVDEFLKEQGLLDTTPQLPPEFEGRLTQLERRNAQLEHQARMNHEAAQMAADARSKAAAISRVFKDVDGEALAQVIVSGGNGVQFARAIYQKMGALGQDNLPTHHPTSVKRAPMPHTRGVQNARTETATKDQVGWSGTNDPAERAKRLSARR